MKRLLSLTLPVLLLAAATAPAHAQSAEDGKDGKAPPAAAPGGRKPLLLSGDRIQKIAGAAGATGGAPTTPTPSSNPTPSNPPPTATPTTPAAPGKPQPGVKASGDTTALPQFEHAMEYEPRSPNAKVSFSLEDANLAELVKVIGQLTGKRFIFGGKVRDIKATVYSPQQVTVAEAYQAFLAILDANGLTVVPHGRFLKIVETAGIQGQVTPTYGPGQAVPAEARFVTRLHRMKNISAEEAVGVVDKFKSKDGQVSAYAAGNMLILTDTGTNIRRMMQIVEQIDVGAAGDQVWIEPVHYAAASDLATRVNDLFDVKGGGKDGKGGTGAGDLHVAKIVPDERSNSLVIVATERAYLRILELIKRLDVPQTGEGEIHVLPLQHADAVELAKTLGDIVGTGPQGGGQKQGGGAPANTSVFEGAVRVSADKSTNSIVVTSSLRDYASLRAVVDRLDQPRRQVFIDAVIMDLAVSRTDSFGTRFHGGSAFDLQSANDTILFGGLDPLKTIAVDPTSLQGAALGIRGPGIEGTQNLIPGLGLSIPAFGATITALTTTSDTDVLSTPHILATDNIPAEISIGENVPIQQNVGLGSLSSLAGASGAAGATGALGALGALGGLGGLSGSAARADVGTKIKIIPHLNESNEARLEITEEISEARKPEGVSQVVPITRRTANTTLVVKDQQTVVIGGLMRNRVAHGATKIPILGDIPLIGALFRQTTTEMQKTNLVLILTPYIIRDQSDLRRVFERKMQERQEFLDRYFVFNESQRYEPPTDYSRTNGLLEEIRQAYSKVEEKKRLEELTRPKELRGHPPQTPLEMPGGGRLKPGGGGGGEPGKPANLNVAPMPKTIERVEK